MVMQQLWGKRQSMFFPPARRKMSEFWFLLQNFAGHFVRIRLLLAEMCRLWEFWFWRLGLPGALAWHGAALVPVSRIWRGPVAAALGGLQFGYL